MSDDYSANVQTTGAVAVGGSATGSIETAHDQDWFAVELEAGRTYQFDLGGSPSGGGTLRDTFLRAIYDSEGRYQSGSYNDDFEGGRDSRVTFTARETGTYYVRASGDRDETGTYTLSVTDVTPGSVEDPPPAELPAETVAPEEPARAAAEDLGDITELAAARFPLGTLDGGADGVAWYRFTLSEARAVGLGLRRQDADADLVLEDAAGNVLHSSERSGTANEWLRETLLAGTYYVGVEAQEAGANAYVFRYGVGAADPAEVARLEADRASAQEQVQQRPPAFGSRFYGFELPEDTDGSANRISLGTVSATDPDGGSVSYSIEGGNAAGLFEIDAASGELFYTGGGEDYETGSTSFELTVRASDGDQTTDTTATVSVTDVDEPVEVDPPVAEPDQSTPQTVSEPAGEDFSAGTSTSGRVAVGDTATGNVGSNGDRDWFAVELVAGRTYVIDLRGSPTDDGTLSDPYLGGIHDSDGNLIARTTNDDGGQGYNSRVTFTATESGTHYIAAGAAGVFSGRGTYEVEVTDTSPPIVAPDPDPEDPPVAQEQEQQQEQEQEQEQDEPPAVTVVPPAEPDTAQAQDEAASVSEGGADLPADVTTPGRVVVSGSATGRIGFRHDRDWFAVELEAGKSYQFDLEGSSTGGGTVRNPYLRGIYDSEGRYQSRSDDDDDGVGRNSRVYFTPEEGATYYVSASGRSFSRGTYTLKVTEIPDDYAAYSATTGMVVVGGSAAGNVEYDGDTDWFAVTLEASKLYRFDLEGSSTGGGTLGDPYLRGIYDANGDRFDGTTNYDSGVGRNSRVYFTPEEGATYYVSAGAYIRDVGTYTLAVTEVSDYPDDYAADPTTTGTVVVGGSATGNVEPPGDRDWFAVELEAGKTYRFDLDGRLTGDSTLFDPYLRGIYDEDGDRIDATTNDNGGAGRNSRVYFTPDEDATYYVSAGDALNRIGTYRLTVSDVTDDYAANPATTGTVVVGGSATGTIGTPGDRDWFAVELEAGQPYRFDLEGSVTRRGALHDPYLRGIYDEEGDRIARTGNDDDGVGLNSRVYFTPDDGGTYYVSAGADSNDVGTYRLKVTDLSDDDYAANSTTTGTVVVGGSATGNLEYIGDTDWFAVTLEAGQPYRIDLEGSPTGGGTLRDPDLRGIYDKDGDRIAGSLQDNNAGVGRNSRIYFTPDDGATYYVSAGAHRGYSDSYAGTYTLAVAEYSDDYAADRTTTGRVVVGGSATGSIEPAGDRDWFAVELEADKMYRIDLEGSPTGGGTLYNTVLRGIYPEYGDRLDGTTDDDGGVGRNSLVYFTPDEDATYYVSAGGYVATGAGHSQVGTYTLTVEEVDAM